MYYYEDHGQTFASLEPLPLREIAVPTSAPTLLYQRPPSESRAAFCPTDLSQLPGCEDLTMLDCSRRASVPLIPELPVGKLRAVNYSHPHFRTLAAWQPNLNKKRVHILALGDVGSTILLALHLLGGDVIASIGICDLSQQTAARWEFEINQITEPWDYDQMPPVSVVTEDALFDCDVFVFAASRGIPPVGDTVKDVRMAQWEKNRELAAHYGAMARQVRFPGLFAVVSDPVDPLCREVFLSSNRSESGVFDGGGLTAEQIQGYGLGVMNARGAYYAKKDPRFADFLTEGRAYGPHGDDLILANSLQHYDDDRSRELTHLAATANLQMRALGFKPYVAPALSSAALSLLLTLRGKFHYGSVCLGGIFFGVKNRYTPFGLETENCRIPDALFSRLQYAYTALQSIC